MFSNTLKVNLINDKKTIYKTISRCFSNGVTTKTNKKEFYKNMAEIEDNTKPINWEKALPFEAIPGPKPLPLIGNMWRFLPKIGEYYNKSHMEFLDCNYKTYGEIFILRGILGFTDSVFIFNPEDIETLHRNEGVWPIRKGSYSFTYYRTVVRKDVFKDVGGVSTIHGEKWFNLRTVINPILMQPRVIEQYIGAMDEISGQLVNNIEHFSKLNNSGEMPENFLNEIYKWSLESIGVIGLDKHFGCLDLNLKEGSEPQQLINCAIEMFKLMYKLDNTPSLWKYISTSDYRRFVEVLDYLTYTTLKYINEALSKLDHNKPEHEMSVLQKLIKKDRQIAIATVMDMMAAGIDTTGKSLAAVLYFLAKNPEKQDILRKELIQNLPNKNSPITKDVLSNSPYLKAAIKESTRLAPVAIGNVRTTVRDLVLGGYQIPKGTSVITLLIYASHQEKYYLQPEKYLPERWLRSTTGELSYRNVHPFATQPFGFGPRACVGKRLANFELEVALAKIIRNFDISWPHKDMKFAIDILYGVADPLKLHVKSVAC